MTQNNLGNALQALGERESGTLEEAVEAYHAALVRARCATGLGHDQNNLVALHALGGT